MASAVVLAVVATVVMVPTVAGAASASTEVITRPDQSVPLNSGGSATEYGVALPSGAGCPGDTAHDGYHVFSYLVPKGVSPTAVSFLTGDPSRYFGYIAEGAYFGAVNTAQVTGQIVTLPPAFTWSRLTPQDLFAHGVTSSIWDGGIACANVHGVVTNYWNSEVLFTASSTDPGGFTWRVIQPQAATSNVGVVVGVGLGAVAVGLGVVAFVLSRRNRKTDVPSPGLRRTEQLVGQP
jgi:hypothetical protein